MLKYIFKVNSSRAAIIDIKDAVLSKSEVDAALDDFVADTSLLHSFPAASLGPAPDMSKMKAIFSANLNAQQKAVLSRLQQRLARYAIHGQKSSRLSSSEALTDILETKIDPNFKLAPISGRWQDVEPYSGGSGYTMDGIECSTGFSFVRVSGNSRTNGLLTAAHCGDYRSGGTAKKRTDDAPIGTFGLLDRCTIFECRDLAYIDMGATAVSGCMFDGPVNPDFSSNYYRKAVDGVASDFVGGYVCASGAYSGASCNIYINWVNVLALQRDRTWNNGNGVRVVRPLTYGHKSGLAPAGNGDSGGPVFSLNGDDGVLAHGIISTQNAAYPAECQGYPSIGGRTCTSDFFWAPIEWYFSHSFNGVSLELPPPQR